MICLGREYKFINTPPKSFQTVFLQICPSVCVSTWWGGGIGMCLGSRCPSCGGGFVHEGSLTILVSVDGGGSALSWHVSVRGFSLMEIHMHTPPYCNHQVVRILILSIFAFFFGGAFVYFPGILSAEWDVCGIASWYTHIPKFTNSGSNFFVRMYKHTVIISVTQQHPFFFNIIVLLRL